MRNFLSTRAREKAAEEALQAQIIPGTYRKFVPEIGTLLAVQFPGEVIRCPVRKVISPDSVLVFVDSVPMAKSHSFEFEKTYGVRRRVRDERDVWEAQKDQDFLNEQARLLEVEARPRATAAKRTPAEISRKKRVK
jgi:hypothetical protein